MPRLSVVVPIYNVEPYLGECLESLARQTFTDLEVVMVDDGSTDASAAIAEDFSARDARFKMVRQANGGLSAARNTGLSVATGEFIAFVDSDDVVAPEAYELLVGSLDKSGSDIASGNVHRLTGRGTRQARFLARTFAETRLSTHITRDRLLLHDRTAWNKVWRRAFWDREGRRFPEGRIYEDIPVTIPLHFAARAVDVHSEVVYYWRTREGVDRSITQRRAEPRALRDRLAAIAEVSDYLASHGLRKEKRWYDASVVADDLKYFLNVLDEADDEYRALFLDRVNAFLDGVSPRAYRRLRARERLKWHLVRRRMLPELLEILRFQRENMRDTTPVLVRGHWYLDHPYRTDRSLKIPSSLFRVDRELRFSTGLDALDWQDGKLRIEGWAYIDGIGAADRRSQHITLTAVPPGRLQAVRRRIGGVRMRAKPVHRPDLVRASGTELADVSWAGFSATLDAGRLRTARRWREGRWDLFITMRSGRLWRAKARFGTDSARPLRAAETAVPGGVLVATAPSPEGQIALRVHTAWAALRAHRRDGDALELTGEAHGIGAKDLTLTARRRGGGGSRKWPVTLAGTRLTARVPLGSLPGEDAAWDLFLAGGGTRRQVTLDAAVADAAWRHDGHEVALERAMDGGAALAVRPPRATIRAAGWTDEGALELAGDARLPEGPHELVLRGRYRLLEHAFALNRRPGGDEFHVCLTPAALPPTLAGVLPLNADTWDLLVRRAGETEGTPVTLSGQLYDRLPLRKMICHKPFRLGMTPDGDAALLVERDRDDEERGRRQQRRLLNTDYLGRREGPLRDAVLFISFGGRQYSDNPRAIHEELARRGTDLEQLWLVRDGRCRVPETATVVRSGSREHYEALATARFVVSNDHFPHWFVRRPDQTCLQTWHGTPLKRLGYDVPPGTRPRKFERNWDQQMDNWQYVLSPNPFTTPILRRAYTIRGELLETGYPRNDVLAGERRAAATAAVRERLGLPEHARVVLYAPTYRDGTRDRSGRYRLDPALDVHRLRAALGKHDVLLFRKHHYVIDPVPVTADGVVRDVSAYPDGTELMLAADVLVTDYSSMMFDFANTGRPMLFFTYDLDEYRDEVRGFYFDFETKAPGPLLRTTEELAGALRELDAVSAAYAERYRAFAQEFCALDDGHAAARVADRLFTGG
jgi:CDP-glycerol glycerophosphotransferase